MDVEHLLFQLPVHPAMHIHYPGQPLTDECFTDGIQIEHICP